MSCSGSISCYSGLHLSCVIKLFGETGSLYSSVVNHYLCGYLFPMVYMTASSTYSDDSVLWVVMTSDRIIIISIFRVLDHYREL